MSKSDFAGLRVLSLESRRSQEMAKLISNFGGHPTVAPSMREVPLEENTEALDFAAALRQGQLDMVICLTGVGTRALTKVVETVYPREEFVAALNKVAVVARGPKPLAALRELGVRVSLTVPEPNTWRELLQSLDDNRESLPLPDSRVAVQEYGVSNPELLEGLVARGASVTSVPVYQWRLPEELSPLRHAVGLLARGKVDVVLFTSSAQVQHLLQIAAGMGLKKDVLRAFARIVIVSIGPITSQELQEHGITADMEPTHPKMGIMVNEAAERSAELLRLKWSNIGAEKSTTLVRIG
jgi:uroporphyrinogen-III synthase